MAPVEDFHIEWVNGRRLLRFTVMMVNVGQGHFELRGSRSSTSAPMRMSQVFFSSTARDAAVTRQVPTDAVASFAGDGHSHWHVNEMMRYDMWGLGGTFRGAKVGFCSSIRTHGPPRCRGTTGPSIAGPCAAPTATSSATGWESASDGATNLDYLAWQWVDITNVTAGTYHVRATVDPYGFFTELDEANQCAWARVRFSGSSSAVTVEATGRSCVNDIAGSIFANDIAWAYEAGITVGCAPNLFCTSNAVTREQMASFLARGLKLPAASRDYFADDESSPHENDINRVAEAGITGGCDTGRFCPRSPVTREEMASFLSRALDLSPTATDFFTDDNASQHESNINRLAAAGITGGCTTTTFCPRANVTRGQMAAFLHRALD